MKKFEKLGKKLSREEQKKIMGGNPGDAVKCGDGCIPLKTNCPTTCPCTNAVGQGNIWKCQTA